jgi:hypothetical protein
LPFNPWDDLATQLHIGAPQKIQEKTNLQPILNKNSPWIHRESKFDMLGVARKLVKCSPFVPKIKNKINYFSFYKVPKQKTTHFGSPRILGINSKVHMWKFNT